MTVHPGLSALLGLHDRVALVTGGSGGIGSAVVRLLLEAGADVLSADVEGGAVEGAVSATCDVGNPDAVAGLVREIDADHGRLDVVVHCAGITRDAVLWKMDRAAWRAVLATNLDSAFFLLHETLPLLRRTGGGSVVVVASINGERGKFGQGNYAASKAGLIALAKTAAREAGAFGIRVNAVSPGLIRTRMTEVLGPEHVDRAREEAALGRLGEPEDVARAVLFLCSDMGRHVTGQVLRVDGGQWMG